MEQLQTTGSFKLRGATNKIMSLSPEAASAGVVTSSTGNHGLGVAAAARYRNIDAEVLSVVASARGKVEEDRSLRSAHSHGGTNPLEAEIAARTAAAESGRTYVVALQRLGSRCRAGHNRVWNWLRQIESIDAVFIATGGGGLISGVGSLSSREISSRRNRGLLAGEFAQCCMSACGRAGSPRFPESYTLSESTAGGVEPGSITFDLARAAMHRGVLVSEDAILEAMKWARERNWTSKALRVWRWQRSFRRPPRYEGKTVVVLFCGGNLSPEVQDQCGSTPEL